MISSFQQLFRRLVLSCISIVFIGILSGCGGGGGGDEVLDTGGGGDEVLDTGGGGDEAFDTGVSISSLDGTWSGTIEDSFTNMFAYQVTIVSGSIIETRVDGIITGTTGTIIKEFSSDVVFSVVLAGGVEAGFIVDSAARYAVFVNEDWSFGVVQKQAGSLPGFLITDIDGNLNGLIVETSDLSANGFVEQSSSGSCTGLICTGTSSNGVTSTVNFDGVFDSMFGRWEGDYTNSAGGSGDVTLLMSTDKQFVGAYACDYTSTFPVGCDFSAWVK